MVTEHVPRRARGEGDSALRVYARVSLVMNGAGSGKQRVKCDPPAENCPHAAEHPRASGRSLLGSISNGSVGQGGCMTIPAATGADRISMRDVRSMRMVMISGVGIAVHFMQPVYRAARLIAEKAGKPALDLHVFHAQGRKRRSVCPPGLAEYATTQ